MAASEVGVGRLSPMRRASSLSRAPARYFWVSSEMRTRFRGGFLAGGARVVAFLRFEGGPWATMAMMNAGFMLEELKGRGRGEEGGRREEGGGRREEEGGDGRGGCE